MLPPLIFIIKKTQLILLSEAWESSRRFVVTGGIGQGKRAITKNIMADLIVGELCTEAPIESHSGATGGVKASQEGHEKGNFKKNSTYHFSGILQAS